MKKEKYNECERAYIDFIDETINNLKNTLAF